MSKKPRARKKESSKKKEPRVITPLEYHQQAYSLIKKAVDDSGYDVNSPHPKRESFFKVVPPGKYSSIRGRELINLYYGSLETEIKNIVSRHSIAYWLHIHRRLLPSLTISEEIKSTTTYLVRATLEAAVQKYAMTSLCDGLGVSTIVPEESILDGLLMHDEFKEIRTAIKKSPQLVLTKFGPEQLKEFFNLSKLCYEVWRCAAALRILGKGAHLEVTDDPIKFYDLRTDELNTLVDNYDKRHNRISPNKSATGTVFDTEDSKMKDSDFFIIPYYNIEQVPMNKFFTDQAAIFQFLFGENIRLTDNYVTNFLWGGFNIKGFYESHKPFAEAFKKQKGVSFYGLIVFIQSLIFRRLMIWRKYGLGFFLHDFERAYEGPNTKIELFKDLEFNLEIFIQILGLNKADLDININDIFTYLELNTERREEIDILLGGPHSIFLPVFDDKYFIDYVWIHMMLYHLFYGIELADQNFKGDALEELVHRGKSVLPTSQLRSLNGKSKQIDAAFEINENLIIVECRVKSWSFGSERGDPEAVKIRKELIERCLKDIDDKAKFLSENPVGANYDISKYQRIIPIGVTPFIEYIPSLDRYFWLIKELPRVMTPDELNEFLDSEILAKTPADLYNVVEL